MSKKVPVNVAASVRQRLLDLARQRGEEFQFVLMRYTSERLLYRLSHSKHADRFILKGAMLFELWTGEPHRSTIDIDLMSETTDSVQRIEAVFREVVITNVEEDGLEIDPATLHGEQIREEQHYTGVRIRAMATLAGARVPVQIDIGFGDAVIPQATTANYPSILGGPRARLRAYPKETVIAEKFEAMVSLGMANTRMKDFYDVHILLDQFEFDGTLLARAIKATFDRRRTALPTTIPNALTTDFGADAAKAKQWTAFVTRGRLRTTAPSLGNVIESLERFLWPPAQAARDGLPFPFRWSQGGEWRE